MSPSSYTSRFSKVRGVAGRVLALACLAGILPACNKTGTNAPQVVTLSPSNAQTGVPLWTPLIVEFDRALDSGTVVGSNFSLQNATNGTTIALQAIWDPAFNEVILVPQSAMTSGATYNAAILAGVEAADGTSFGGNSWSFTTETTALVNAPSFTGALSAMPVTGMPGVLEINWTAATDADAQSVTYQVFQSSSSGGENFLFGPAPVTVVQSAAGPSVSNVQISGLTSGVPYFFMVEAVEGSSGNEFFNFQEVSGVPN